MGQEIASSTFTPEELEQFKQQLQEETALLRQWFSDNRFADAGYVGGFELEAWLLDATNYAAPDNAAFLDALDNPDVVPELATFNFEVNGPPAVIQGNALDTMYQGLLNTWRKCSAVAAARNEKIIMIGILPHLRESDLTLENMSAMSRYKALNHQVLKMRNFEPLHLHITGRDEIDTHKYDVMLEAATTSFQVHFQIPLAQSVPIFNASLLASAPVVAAAANSPYLFGKDLWEETRIPLFEQSVRLGGPGQHRVSFGYGYLEHSLLECFEANLADYPVLLPLVNDAPPEKMSHVKFHNGTIWRWNRPLIDFNRAGDPTLRIEHRVIPSGPTILDSFANAAFYYGLTHGLTFQHGNIADAVPFDEVKSSFYDCARYGLDAPISWLGGEKILVSDLITSELVPLATDGLLDLGVSRDSAAYWLNIIRQRATSRQNGAHWQRSWIARHAENSHDMMAMVARYYELQQSEQPVHEWPI